MTPIQPYALITDPETGNIRYTNRYDPEGLLKDSKARKMAATTRNTIDRAIPDASGRSSNTAELPVGPPPHTLISKIAVCVSKLDANGLTRLCRFLPASYNLDHLFHASSLQKEPQSFATNGLETLIALATSLDVAARMTRLSMIVTGPVGAETPLPASTLQTRPVLLGWEAQLCVCWAVPAAEKARLQKVCTVALSQILLDLRAAKSRTAFAIIHDRGWEKTVPPVVGKKFDLADQNSDIALSALLDAWHAISYNLRSLTVRGDVGTADLDSDSPLLDEKTTSYTTLQTLDIDLHQRYTVRPPYKVLALLRAARHVTTLSFRWNLRNQGPLHDVLAPLKQAITRRHRIGELRLWGVWGHEADFVLILERIRATLTKVRLRKVEIAGCVIEGDGSWEDAFAVLEERFEIRELVMGYLGREKDGGGRKGKKEGREVWEKDGEVVWMANGREEVVACFEKVAKGGFVPVDKVNGRTRRGRKSSSGGNSS